MRSWDEQRVGWRVVGSFGSYQQAQRAVDQLAGARFPVRQVTIVARGLRLPEPRGDRSGYGWAAVHGLLVGVPVAAILGILVAVTALDEPLTAGLTLAAWAALAGAVAGVVIGVGVEALRSPQPADRLVLHADRYDLIADAEVADQAHHLLDRLGHSHTGQGQP